MPELDDVLARLRQHEGVEHLILLGSDGLVVQHIGVAAGSEEAIAARVPALVAAGDALGRVADVESLGTAVLEFAAGVVIVVTLSGELLLCVLVRAGVGFAPLLRDLRRDRSRLIQLL